VTIVTEKFVPLSNAVAESLGKPDVTRIVIPHPFGGVAEAIIRERAREVAARIPEFLVQVEQLSAIKPVETTNDPGNGDEPGHAPRFSVQVVEDSELTWELDRLALTDGLPVIPPTEDRVRRMLKYHDGDPKGVIGPIPPRWTLLTVEAAAANAVMAGCRPEHLPMVIQSIEAMLPVPEVNLSGIQVTTHPVSPMCMVSGSIAQELGIWGGVGCLGPGWPGNAAVGRAIRLILMNGGGARPGGMDAATMGQPGKFSFCFSENEANSPWEPYRVEHGFAEWNTTITLVGAEAPHNINDHGSTDAEGILRTLAGSMTSAGNNNMYWLGDAFLILGPEHAETMAREGLSKQDVKRELHRRARFPVDQMSPRQFQHYRSWIDEHELDHFVDANDRLALVRNPEDIHIVVAGGQGKHSMWVPTWFRSVTRALVDKEGHPIHSIQELRQD
jgi:hypothetical protein